MAATSHRDHFEQLQSDEQERKLNFLVPRRNIRLPRFSVPWAYTKSITTLMESFEIILKSDESLALHMNKPLYAHQLEEILQQALGCPSPRVVEDNSTESAHPIPPTWTSVLAGATPDQFDDQGDQIYHRSIDGVVFEIPAFVFDKLETFQSMIGQQPAPNDMRLEADAVSDVSDQLAELVKVLTETRQHVMRVQSGFQKRSNAIRRHFETQSLPVSNKRSEEEEESRGVAHNLPSQRQPQPMPASDPGSYQATLQKEGVQNLSSQHQPQSMPASDPGSYQATLQKEGVQNLSFPSQHQPPLSVGPEEQGQERYLQAIGQMLEGHVPPRPILNMSRKKNQKDRQWETIHGHPQNSPQQSASSVSEENHQEARHMQPTPDCPSEYQYRSLWDVSQGKYPDTPYKEASRKQSCQTQHNLAPNMSQEARQEQRQMEVTPQSPARIQIPSSSREERENSILSSPGGDIPYRAPPADEVPPGALEENEVPVSQNFITSTSNDISREEDAVDILDDSAYSTTASDARSPTTPNTEIMPDDMETALRRLSGPDSNRTGLEGIPVATNGNPMPPSADERENGYYFIESAKLHGTTWKQIVPLYAHRFNVVRSTNGLQQHWMKWRDQGRKLVILKYRRNKSNTGI